MRATDRPTLTLPTGGGQREYATYLSRQGAMRSASASGALWDRVRIVRLVGGAYTWVPTAKPLPAGGRVVARWTGSAWE